MAISSNDIRNFIETIAPIIQKYAKQRGYKLASPIIAQACLESAYGTSGLAKYHNYFGLKCGSSWSGPSVNMKTKEEYNSQIVSIKDNFRVFSSLENGVIGYFDFISRSRYANLKTATSPRQYLEFIKADGYATISNYVDRNMKVVQQYNLQKYDDFDNQNILSKKEVSQQILEQIADQVIQGKWGNGQERKIKLTQAGYDYDQIQGLVQERKIKPVQYVQQKLQNDILVEGDKIKLDPKATYVNGKKIPNWVKKSTLYYRGKNAGGIIFSTKKTGSITGVVENKYVSKV